MLKDSLNEEEINIAFLGKEFVQKLKLIEKRNKRKISIGIFILFLVVGKVI